MTDPAASSVAKGETLADTVRIVESYTDLLVLRHPCAGAARVAADFAGIPVINAGDGAREHPTQTLLDLFTICQEKGRIRGVTVALCGDLKHGRTVHSLVQALARFGAHLLCVAPEGLELPQAQCRELTARYGISIAQYASLEDAPLDVCDVLYVTRLQKERFADPLEFARLRSSYQVSRRTLARAHTDAIVLHPLPRVDELDYALDGDPRAAYFRQAAYGVPVRMALIAALLGLRTVPGFPQTMAPDCAEWQPLPDAALLRCRNPRCITQSEPAVLSLAETRADGARRCGYCEALQEVVCPVS
jgi:aspartate carbamoyltransferase catalytic subunit